jgi:serine/threonine-protein kinase
VKSLGAYTVHEKLGRGGMGAVYRGSDAQGNGVAIKVIDAALAEEEGARRRFEHECSLLRGLDHPGIVRALTGLLEESGQVFYVMELVPGEDLARRLQRGALPAGEAVAVATGVLEALAFAHGRGILHRDVKPSNVFVGPDGRAKLGDFGLAHAAGQTRLTSTGAVVGTPEYMAPEQAEGLALSERTDLYAVGVLLYEALAGRPPFRAESPLAVLRMHVDRRPPPLPASVSTELAQVVERALEKEPGRRFPKAQEMIAALAAAKDARPRALDMHALATAETTEMRPAAQATTVIAPPVPPARRRSVAVPLVVVACVLGGLALAWRMTGNPPKGPPPAPSEPLERVVVDMKDGRSFEGDLLDLDLSSGTIVTRLDTGEICSTSLTDVRGYHKPGGPR